MSFLTKSPEKNEPPVAKVRGDHVVRFPETNATLDGSDSEDDYKKGMKYLWTQIRYNHYRVKLFHIIMVENTHATHTILRCDDT